MTNSLPTSESAIVVMDQAYMSRVLLRIAHQVIEATAGDTHIILFGINQRGQFIAEQLASAISSLLSEEILTFDLYLDYKTNVVSFDEADQLPNELQNQHVLVVDDVIFSGITMFKAVNYLIESYEFKSLMTASLIDRGHRKVPVKCDFCGLLYPTKLNEQIFARVGEDQEQEEADVILIHSAYDADSLKR
jgi:pyrimidine operon attenuation protein/uracil phosphoribosyltransferase